MKLKQRIQYVSDNYNDRTHYDLAMSLLCDGFTDDLSDLCALCNGVFGSQDSSSVTEAYNDYQE